MLYADVTGEISTFHASIFSSHTSAARFSSQQQPNPPGGGGGESKQNLHCGRAHPQSINQSVSLVVIQLSSLLPSQSHAHKHKQISYEKNLDTDMQRIMKLAHEFLQVFCKQNAPNQALLHKDLNLFLTPGVSSAESHFCF